MLKQQFISELDLSFLHHSVYLSFDYKSWQNWLRIRKIDNGIHVKNMHFDNILYV